MALTRPLRSVLYIPAARARALEKARTLAADAIIFDLEDAVAVDEKETARQTLRVALAQGGYAERLKIIRINALDTQWGHDDAKAAMFMDADAILLPKVNSAQELDALAELVPDRPLWAMMETPMGMLNAPAIAAHPKLQGMVMGTNDLGHELKIQPHPERIALMTSLGLCLLAARAHAKTIIDGVYNAFKDDKGLRIECEQGRNMGFDGKTLIHPAQLAIANDTFAPTQVEIDLARRQIQAFQAAEAAGEGVAVVDGKIVENLHVETARITLARADAIAKLEAQNKP